MQKMLTILYVMCCVLVAGLLINSFRTPEKPSIQVGGLTFYLTRAYSDNNTIVNIYQTDSLPAPTIRISAMPSSDASNMVYEAMFQTMHTLAQIVPEQKHFSAEKDKSSFTASDTEEDNSYRYIRFNKMPKNLVTLSFTGLPLDENLTQTDEKWRSLLDAVEIPRIYSVRPGEKGPDESEELEKLKQLLAAPYNPQMQVVKNNNITTVRFEDANQQQAFELISKGQETDAAAWLQENFDRLPPLYLYAFAARQASAGAPYRDFLFWFFAASLRGGADAALCQDKYAGQYLTGLKYKMADISQSVYAGEPQDMSPDKAREWMKSIVREVADWDARHPQKNNPDWICKSGHAVRTDDAYPQKEWEARRKEFKGKYTASAFSK